MRFMAKTDEFKIDGHKLIYHIDRVNQWLRGAAIYPIYIEIGLYGGCNHRCIFCAFDFFKYKPDILDEIYLKRFVIAAAEKGVKAILYSGEGEPLLHKNAAEVIGFTKKMGIDVAIATNGVMLNKDLSEKILGYLSWIKVSLDSGFDNSYRFIHGAKKGDFQTVLKNLREAVKIRNRHKYICTIGVQFLLIPQNYKEVISAVKIARDLGVDYLVVKPYCEHPSSGKKIASSLKYRDLFFLEDKIARYSNTNFHVIFRHRAMEKQGARKSYKYCLGLPFAAHITASGDIYPCNVFLGKKNFILGNIYKESFKDIWEGGRRKRIKDLICTKWNIKNCRNACRLDEINRYLWELKNPIKHVNFI